MATLGRIALLVAFVTVGVLMMTMFTWSPLLFKLSLLTWLQSVGILAGTVSAITLLFAIPEELGRG